MAKEDSDELQRDKKRVRFEDQTAPVTMQARGAKRASEDDERADLDEAQLETAKRAAEQGLELLRRKNKRESFENPREVRAKTPEARGMKRTSEDNGRADLDSDDIIINTRVNAVVGNASTKTNVPVDGLMFEGRGLLPRGRALFSKTRLQAVTLQLPCKQGGRSARLRTTEGQTWTRHNWRLPNGRPSRDWRF